MELNDHLKALVEKELQLLGYRNNSIKMSRGTSVGDNYLAVITLIDINAIDAECKPAKLHWIAKTAHQSKQFREYVKLEFVYNREVYMYREILPTFEKLQKKTIAEPQLFKSYPRFITSSLEEFHETVIMENLKAKGYIMKNRREPLDYNHTKYVITHYAKFHALSYALREQDPEKFEKIAKNIESHFFDDYNKESMQTTFASICGRAFKAFTEDDEKELALLRHLEEHAYEVLTFSCKGSEAGKYAVFLHGDSWINNMLFKYDVSNFSVNVIT